MRSPTTGTIGGCTSSIRVGTLVARMSSILQCRAMRAARGVVTVAVWIAAASGGAAQTFPSAVERSFVELRAAVPHAEVNASQRIELRWMTPVTAERTAVRAEDVRIVSRVRGEGPLPQERDPQLSPDRLVVVSSDAAGRELDWRIVPDPRFIRGETADAQGRITSRRLQRAEANLLVDIPDRPDIVLLRVYATEWVNDAFVLRLVATADLR